MSRKADIFKVEKLVTYETEADDAADAEDKADAYWAAHLDEFNPTITSREVWVEEEE